MANPIYSAVLRVGVGEPQRRQFFDRSLRLDFVPPAGMQFAFDPLPRSCRDGVGKLHLSVRRVTWNAGSFYVDCDLAWPDDHLHTTDAESLPLIFAAYVFVPFFTESKVMFP